MIVISDTSPLNYLALIDAVDVLGELCRQVLIPEAVLGELQSPGTPLKVRRWIAAPPAWLTVRTAPDALHKDLQALDPGERETLSLALFYRLDIVLLDDREGRRAGYRNGLRVIGTLGVLEWAAAQGLLNLHSVIDRLRQTNFRIKQELIAELLAKEARRKR